MGCDDSTNRGAALQNTSRKSCHHTPLQIKNAQRNSPCQRPFRGMKMLAALSFLCLFAASSAAGDGRCIGTLTPTGLQALRTSASHDCSSRRALQSRRHGYAVEWQSHIPLGQYHEFGQTTSGSVGLADHQWRENGYFSTQSVQLDVNSILPQGVIDEKLQLGSVHSTSNERLGYFWALPRSATRECKPRESAAALRTWFSRALPILRTIKLTSAGSVSGTLMTCRFSGNSDAGSRDRCPVPDHWLGRSRRCHPVLAAPPHCSTPRRLLGRDTSPQFEFGLAAVLARGRPLFSRTLNRRPPSGRSRSQAIPS